MAKFDRFNEQMLGQASLSPCPATFRMLRLAPHAIFPSPSFCAMSSRLESLIEALGAAGNSRLLGWEITSLLMKTLTAVRVFIHCISGEKPRRKFTPAVNRSETSLVPPIEILILQPKP
ncbi:hypothetical protein DQ393_02390 [Rhizobium tropici]|uniref:Uncharacterized protein n=1 Tax=Rhizobium tropici TaxID=398 RepID=A0A329YIE9_RHITR|nr:hypothetical protein DQ393_02390 [Rhizobium tropici]